MCNAILYYKFGLILFLQIIIIKNKFNQKNHSVMKEIMPLVKSVLVVVVGVLVANQIQTKLLSKSTTAPASTPSAV